MPVEAVAEANRSPGVTPAAPWRVAAVSVEPGYRLAVRFVDGSQGVVDMSRLVNSANPGIYSDLKSVSLFSQARLELGVITWPNGADLDPDWMHEEIGTRGEWVVPDS